MLSILIVKITGSLHTKGDRQNSIQNNDIEPQRYENARIDYYTQVSNYGRSGSSVHIDDIHSDEFDTAAAGTIKVEPRNYHHEVNALMHLLSFK